MLNLNAKEKSARDILLKYVKILDIFSNNEKPLLDLEIRVLVEFLMLPEKFKYNRFSTLARKKVIRSLIDLYDWEVSPSNLNTKVYSLRDRNYIWKDEDGVLYVKDFLVKITNQILKDKETKVGIIFTYEEATEGETVKG